MSDFPIVETECTITGPEGQSFTAMGAVFDLERGGCLYVSGEMSTIAPNRYNDVRGPLTTWHGERVGTWWNIGSYYNNFGAKITCIRATVQGREFYGRYGSEWSQLIRLRPCKRAA